MKWAVDAMLGDLGRFLLILGEDVLYKPSLYGFNLIKIAKNEGRTILTRNTKLLNTRSLSPVVFVPDINIWDKIKYIQQNLSIEFHKDKIFSRCLLCNIELSKYNPKDHRIEHEIPQRILNNFELFICCKCKKVYWFGGHYFRTIKNFEDHKICS